MANRRLSSRAPISCLLHRCREIQIRFEKVEACRILECVRSSRSSNTTVSLSPPSKTFFLRSFLSFCGFPNEDERFKQRHVATLVVASRRECQTEIGFQIPERPCEDCQAFRKNIPAVSSQAPRGVGSQRQQTDSSLVYVVVNICPIFHPSRDIRRE